MNTLTFLIGAQGSGKSTYAKTVTQTIPYVVVVSTDQICKKLLGSEENQNHRYLIMNEVRKQTAKYLAEGFDVIIDATNSNPRNIRIHSKIINALLRTEYHSNNQIILEGIYFEVPLDTCIKRNANRERKAPEDVIERTHQRIEQNKHRFPELFDTFSIINESNLEEDYIKEEEDREL